MTETTLDEHEEIIPCELCGEPINELTCDFIDEMAVCEHCIDYGEYDDTKEYPKDNSVGNPFTGDYE